MNRKKEIRKRLEKLGMKEFGFIMMVHFPSVRPGQVEDLRCEVCEDLKDKHCPGKNLKGEDAFLCMIEKTEQSEFYEMDSNSTVH